jgi:hypothetical protein
MEILLLACEELSKDMEVGNTAVAARVARAARTAMAEMTAKLGKDTKDTKGMITVAPGRRPFTIDVVQPRRHVCDITPTGRCVPVATQTPRVMRQR